MSFQQLPDDVVATIANSLDYKDYLRFRVVNCAIRNLARSLCDNERLENAKLDKCSLYWAGRLCEIGCGTAADWPSALAHYQSADGNEEEIRAAMQRHQVMITVPVKYTSTGEVFTITIPAWHGVADLAAAVVEMERQSGREHVPGDLMDVRFPMQLVGRFKSRKYGIIYQKETSSYTMCLGQLGPTDIYWVPVLRGC